MATIELCLFFYSEKQTTILLSSKLQFVFFSENFDVDTVNSLYCFVTKSDHTIILTNCSYIKTGIITIQYQRHTVL